MLTAEDKFGSNVKLHAVSGLNKFKLYKLLIIHPIQMFLPFRATAVLC